MVNKLLAVVYPHCATRLELEYPLEVFPDADFALKERVPAKTKPIKARLVLTKIHIPGVLFGEPWREDGVELELGREVIR